ncbi:hypothetical protein CC86DRAFT_376069 [Ophiobolus disseminans]|uniref:Secreted protein n=1 Tax=Ophiobolus disseminans TaxID=1469910 RepID=A0A6A7AI53_9PLEO|nr:hypothetical protein CC86DRAFT_376069 [Ophiobolus disseminans]
MQFSHIFVLLAATVSVSAKDDPRKGYCGYAKIVGGPKGGGPLLRDGVCQEVRSPFLSVEIYKGCTCRFHFASGCNENSLLVYGGSTTHDMGGDFRKEHGFKWYTCAPL